MKEIEFVNYSCYYLYKKEYIKVLDDISFFVSSGDFLVIVGPSGSGKTTLIKSILGQIRYIEGDLLIQGKSIDTYKMTPYTFGYVSQQYSLYPHLTVFENIAFPLRAMHTSQEEVNERVMEIAIKFKISFLLTRKPAQLSIGQQALVCLAKAIIKKPNIVLLDEPFSSLDNIKKIEMRELLKDIHNTYHTTFLYVTHEMADAYALADKIVFLNQGKIEKITTAKELLEQAKNESV